VHFYVFFAVFCTFSQTMILCCVRERVHQCGYLINTVYSLIVGYNHTIICRSDF